VRALPTAEFARWVVFFEELEKERNKQLRSK
jgi:hypothetical protein